MGQAGLFSGVRPTDIIGDDGFVWCNSAGSFDKIPRISNCFNIETDDLRVGACCKISNAFDHINVRLIADTDGRAETDSSPGKIIEHLGNKASTL